MVTPNTFPNPSPESDLLKSTAKKKPHKDCGNQSGERYQPSTLATPDRKLAVHSVFQPASGSAPETRSLRFIHVRRERKPNALPTGSPHKMGVFRMNTEDNRVLDFGEREVKYAQNEVFLSCGVMQTDFTCPSRIQHILWNMFDTTASRM
jgi:hypothetical protein